MEAGILIPIDSKFGGPLGMAELVSLERYDKRYQWWWMNWHLEDNIFLRKFKHNQMKIPKNSILKSRYQKAKTEWIQELESVCDSCGKTTRNLDCSHVISRQQCLNHGTHIMPNGKPLYTLYYDPKNFRAHCNEFHNDCHRKYENGDFIGLDYHRNMELIESCGLTELYEKAIQKFDTHDEGFN
jgi:hypothetical protein